MQLNSVKIRRGERRQNFSKTDRIVLGLLAYLICELHFTYQDTRTYLKDIPLGMAKRARVAILIIPVFITFLVIDKLPRIEKRLKPQRRIIY